MQAKIFKALRRVALLLVILLSAFRSQATHIFGIDLYYSWVSGNTYTIHLVVYGDCSGSAFPSLNGATPVVNVYNGNTSITSVTLTEQAPAAGVEVTPVCPAELDSTTCTNLTYRIPGIKKFVYTGNVTLSGTSAVWRFLFQGSMGGASSAGRSGSITNIVGGSTSTIQLVDTLNNTTFNNSSAVYTTIPTPFFCLDVPANFNPGAVDPNGDSLVYHLVNGIDAGTGSPVTYVAPYTAIAPIGAAAGTYSFSTATGQLVFTPNILQKALVVYNVEEWHNGVLRGTSQREMTVVVITPCTNTPPNAVISSPSAGTVTGGTTISLCQSVGPFTFQLDPTDPDGNHITMSATGLPTGATFSTVGNGSLAPAGTFSWSTTGVTPGSYIFYVNYQDDGCPLSGQQTIAYTIVILPVPTEAYALVSPATCPAKAVFHVTPGGSASPWTMSVIQGGVTVQTIPGVTGVVTDSLVPGTYTIRMTNPSGCSKDTTVTLVSPPLPVPSVTTTTPLCPGGSTGSATITASAGLAPYVYAIGAGAYGSSGTFGSLRAGSYVLHIKDGNGCIKDTTITVPDATPIRVFLNVHRPLCNTFANGYVVANPYNSIAPYTYAIGAGAYGTNDTFAALAAGSYALHVKNANGCQWDTTITLVDSETIHATLTIAPILCHAGTGTVTINGAGGFGRPYSYAYGTGVFGADSSFSLSVGTYAMHIKDGNACFFDTSVTLTQPTAITIATADTNIHCNGAATGIIVVAATGGTPAYQYNVDAGAYAVSNILGGLTAGRHGISVEDNNGCIYTDSVTLTQPTPVHIDSVTARKPLCNGGSDGSLTIYGSGGIPPYTYASGAGSYGAANLFSGLALGSYTLHVQDANGCIKDTTVSLLQPAAIVPAAAVLKSVCNPLSTGKVTLSATGGTPGYTYAMGIGAYGAAAAFTALGAATYVFHIKDANGCTKDTSITVTDSLRVTGAFVVTPALCYGQASGTINAAGSTGAAPYSYAINAGTYSTVHLFTGLSSGSDSIHIEDVNGCRFDTSVSISQPTGIVPGIAITAPTCHGYNNGAVTVSATGGTVPYLYSYDHGGYSATTVYPTQVAGTDSVLIKDANGCLYDTVFTITQPDKIRFTIINSTNVSCFSASDGTVTISATGATPPYMYGLNALPWQTANAFSGITAGLQAVKMEDSHNCEADTNITITQPAQLVFTAIDSLNPTCPGYSDGSVKLTVSGGTSPYTYADDNATFTGSNAFTALAAGLVTFEVKDANGCSIDTSLTLAGISKIVIDSVTITQPLCHDVKDGSLSLRASGGAQPLAYQLNAAAKTTTALYTGIAGGPYTVTITDSRKCTIDTSLFVPQPDALVVTDSVTPNECNEKASIGSVSAYVTGGTSPYAYAWNNNPAWTTAGIASLPNGKYLVWVTDANNCTDSSSAEVVYDDCCTPVLPNAFTPNGDGKNEIYRFRFVGDMFIVRFSIYNRFGQEVYNLTNTADLNQGWDGKLLGVPAEMGVYFYYAKIICGNRHDHIKEMKGDVTLVR